MIPQLKEKTTRRLDEWERRLGQALSRTNVESERRRFQRELSELRTVREELGRLSDEQLLTLHERLVRDPTEWIEHRKSA